MTYVYDLILNYRDELYEFYEWDKQDEISHIKRINLLKITSKDYNNLLDNNIKFNDDLLIDIFNHTEIYENKKVVTIPYALLVTDGYRVMALLLNNDGLILQYSSLLLDEEEDVLEISIRIPIVKIAYNILEHKEIDYLTRIEKQIVKYLQKDIANSYSKKDYDKLKYLYYEYFNQENDNIELVYHKLMNILKDEINNKHYDLYNLIKLSYSNKT